MFGSDIIKDYYIIHFNFTHGIEKYFVYKYMRNRKLTTKQMWKVIHENEGNYNSNLELEYKLISESKAIDIGQTEGIISDLKLPVKRSHRLITFNWNINS